MLSRDFYVHEDVVEISRQLLGKILFTRIGNELTGGKIVETEAYCGLSDKASHAFPNKKTKRNQVMFEEGGVAYVYMIYGIHYLFNVVTGPRDMPNAVLVRALEPVTGLEVMCRRRKKQDPAKITSGPGSLSLAMGINLGFYGSSLRSDKIWIDDPGEEIPETKIIATSRIGVDYAGADALLPWRFYLKDNPWISRRN